MPELSGATYLRLRHPPLLRRGELGGEEEGGATARHNRVQYHAAMDSGVPLRHPLSCFPLLSHYYGLAKLWCMQY